MSNFHTDKWIMERINKNLDYAINNYIDYQQIIGAFYIGSANYGLDNENSDVDIKLLILPTSEDITKCRTPISTTKTTPWGDQIQIKDIRKMFQEIEKQNVNAIEILFTEYKIVLDPYKTLWYLIEKEAENYCNIHPYAFIKSCNGVLQQWISKYDINPTEKSKTRIIFYYECINKYIDGKSVKECITYDDGPRDPLYFNTIMEFFNIENPYIPNEIDERTKNEMWRLVETFIYLIFMTKEDI